MQYDHCHGRKVFVEKPMVSKRNVVLVCPECGGWHVVRKSRTPDEVVARLMLVLSVAFLLLISASIARSLLW